MVGAIWSVYSEGIGEVSGFAFANNLHVYHACVWQLKIELKVLCA